MGKQKTKKGPTRKVPKRRNAEARILEEPQYHQRKVRKKDRGQVYLELPPTWWLDDDVDSY